MDVTAIKQRFEIIGTSPLLDRALDIAAQVAATDLSVLVTGETGVGKEFIPKIIHVNSARKHGNYFAVNCGAIPEGTIDSELFGHRKGSFTGAHEDRMGYFEVADGGTLFLDEVAELPLSTQVRLLRALETGEFIRVGSSKVQKTDVRVIAATNINLPHAIKSGKFREDLYYRLNTVPIMVPALRERPGDIHLLFRKFAADFAEKYKMPVIRLTDEARNLLEHYRWPGNVRQLKNVAEQLSVLEQKRLVSAESLQHYLPPDSPLHLPVVYNSEKSGSDDFLSERDILYKILFQLRSEMDEMKQKLVALEEHGPLPAQDQGKMLPHPIHKPLEEEEEEVTEGEILPLEIVEESPDLSLDSLEKELIVKVLRKNKGHRKSTAKELGIAERTLYRKIKEYGIE
ncbi:MAG: sigma-54 dependent transcriptional regulator [Bacteroidales bacterium]|nr:sigma-54 dependent transcriptional regulator [Bacteroidales bacterium]